MGGFYLSLITSPFFTNIKACVYDIYSIPIYVKFKAICI